MKMSTFGFSILLVVAVGKMIAAGPSVFAANNNDADPGAVDVEKALDSIHPKWRHEYLRPTSAPYPDDNRYTADRGQGMQLPLPAIQYAFKTQLYATAPIPSIFA